MLFVDVGFWTNLFGKCFSKLDGDLLLGFFKQNSCLRLRCWFWKLIFSKYNFALGFVDFSSVKFEILVFDAESEPKFHISSFLFDLEIAMLNIYVIFCQIILSCFFDLDINVDFGYGFLDRYVNIFFSQIWDLGFRCWKRTKIPY